METFIISLGLYTIFIIDRKEVLILIFVLKGLNFREIHY